MSKMMVKSEANAKTDSTVAIGRALSTQFKGHSIRYRESDGYVHATDMCKVGGKKWKHYNENKSTKTFIAELSSEVGIPTSNLAQSTSGGDSILQGTWIHPHIAINLAQWVSPMFAVFVAKLMARYLAGDLTLVKDVVEQANEVTGMANNVEVRTNSDNPSETATLINTVKPGDYESNIKFRVLKDKITKLESDCAEKDTMIAEFRQLCIDVKVGKARVEAILHRTEAKLDETKAVVVETQATLNRVAQQRVVSDKGLDDKYINQLVIFTDNTDGWQHDLYAFRGQDDAVAGRLARLKADRPGNDIGEWFRVGYDGKVNNAVMQWKSFTPMFRPNIRHQRGGMKWFRLHNCTDDEFKAALSARDVDRINEPEA